jgi:ATP-binding cassette subfamily B protein
MAAEEEAIGKVLDRHLMRRLLSYLRPYRWQVYTALAAIVLKAGMDVVGPLFVKIEIDKYLTSGARGQLNFFERFVDRHLSADPWTGITQICLAYVGALLLSFFLEFAQTYLMQWAGQRAMFDMRSQIFAHLQHLHVAFFDKNPVGRLVTRATSDVDALNDMFTAGVVAIFEDLFVLLGIMAVMLFINWKLALVTFAVLPIIFYATMKFRASVRASYRITRTAVAKINAFTQEHVSGIMVLQLFNREKRSYDEFREVNRENMHAWRDAIMAHAIYYPVVEILSTIAIASLIWVGGNAMLLRAGYPTLESAFTAGVFTSFVMYAQRFFRPIMDLSDKYNILQSAMASSERIFKLLDTPVEIADAPAQIAIPTAKGEIEFDHVWFAYRKLDDGEWDWILRDVSFRIDAGETIAIVGHTGAGKTTIISLLMRFYDVQRGTIKVDGVDIRQLPLAELRRRFGVVLQDPFLFTGTIEDNIRLGTDRITRENILQATEDVNLADFIAGLPGGLGEPVRERGNTLSTGQKQLISFARALAHDPRILILDEATSSVDTETEVRVRNALSKLVEGRTSVIIAHRLSTIQQADKILVMHKGQLREMGNHQQLLAQRGLYYKLYQLQYKDQEIGVPAD